jgi:prepilin-type N-terminal cleavage/methylation domain-containing protein
MRKNAGFTLIEILVALLILAIGMAAVVGLVIGAQRISNNTSDRNIARALITEAVADIERMHLITNPMPNAIAVPADEVGLLLETTNWLPAEKWAAPATPELNPNPNIHRGIYRNVEFDTRPVYDTTLGILDGSSGFHKFNCFPPAMADHPKNTLSTLIWPWNVVDPKLIGGQNNGASDPTSYGYRIIYRLERHLDWVYDDDVYAGIYVLTLTAYRDMDRKGGRLEQLCDPMVVYLRDKKVRPLE